MSGSDALIGVARLFKRVKNITKGISARDVDLASLGPTLREPAEQALWQTMTGKGPAIRAAIARGAYKDAFTEIAALQPVVTKFFDDVLVMAEDADLRAARLALVASLRDLILELADISEMAPE
jgi:glycyl-tRNA synthetase beta chain